MVRWDGMNADSSLQENIDKLRALAGDRFVDVAALVRNDDGDLVPVLPGWVVAPWPDRPEGLGIFSPAARRHWEASR